MALDHTLHPPYLAEVDGEDGAVSLVPLKIGMPY
jgi:hypothetical protein